MAAWAGCASTSQQRIDTVKAYREARAAGDHAAARAMLGDDPRVWFESREGPGRPLDPEGKDLYREWDLYFRSKGEDLRWETAPDSVSVIRSEMNDYFRLIERNGSWYRMTYFFDERGRIEGYMVSGCDDAPVTVDRFKEFEAWAIATHPEEWEYLRPGGRLDPTGDRALRTRGLLNEWRRSIGLAPID